MKLGELNENCGKCKVINCCGEPFSEVCLCENIKLQDIEEDDYLFYRKIKDNILMKFIKVKPSAITLYSNDNG